MNSSKDALSRQHRPENHFTGQQLASQLDSQDFIKALKSDNEIPDFLKLNQKIDCFSDSGEDSISTACMYTEMTLKNSALYAPKFPILTAPIVAP